MPILEQPFVQHDQYAPDVAGAAAIEIQRGCRGVEIFRLRSIAIAFEELHGHQSIKKIVDGAWVQSKLAAEFAARQFAIAELSEEVKSDGREKYLGIPEAESSLQNRSRVKLLAGAVHQITLVC